MDLSRHPFAHPRLRAAAADPRGRHADVPPTPAPSAFDAAIEHFARGRWADAFEALAALADAGRPEAARIALLMATRGPRLFGQGFAASPGRREHWQRIADRR